MPDRDVFIKLPAINLLQFVFSALLGLCSSALSASDNSFERRLDEISKGFIGQPYLLSPLGEAAGIDTDPLIRFDAFDCTTYVETVIAMARSDTPQDYQQNLSQLRYVRGQPAFAKRRHLPSFQWLPGLISAGVLRDVTVQLGQARTGYIHKKISPAIWRQRPVVAGLDAEIIEDASILMPYIPLQHFAEQVGQLREIAVLSVVRRNREQYPLLITHQALLIPGTDGHRVRHARSGRARRVVEEPLARFLQRLSRYRDWPVLGLHVADVLP